MGEIQEQKYVCKICSKSCVSGKSLGGHMRAHLALISASKKAAKIKIDDDQSNSALLIEEKINDCDFGDGDQSSNYELRENPKKSWRISFSDVKNGVMMNSNSCKECGKEFPSSRALSGHMRCHSIKNNKEVHHCKDCGKGFDSVKAMFGHLKTHSKKLREARYYAVSLSDLDSFCPVRRKRSRIKYKTGPNPSVSDVNVSKNSSVSELGDAEEVAMWLIMLSTDVRDSLKFEKESDDDDSVYCGGAAELTVSAMKSSSIEGIEKWPYEAAAIAFKAIPRTLAQNCGVLLNQLLAAGNWRKYIVVMLCCQVRSLCVSFKTSYLRGGM